MPRSQESRSTGPWLRALGLSAFTLLAGCGWFGGGSIPTQKARPGADRDVQATGALPAAGSTRPYDQGIVAADETRGGAQIGSVVPASGGQKAQIEAAEKEAAERDAKAREEREKREAAEKEAKANEPQEPAKPPPTPGLPGMPAAAVRGGESADTPQSGGLKAPGAAPAEPGPTGPVPAPAATPPGQPAATTAPPPAPVDSQQLPPPTAPASETQTPPRS